MTRKTANAVQLLVFTDLDGSLLEHESYSIEPALPSLQALRERNFTLVMNSSKTAAEMLALQEKLALRAPFIYENGAALKLLSNHSDSFETRVFGLPRTEWLPKLHALRAQHAFDFEGFADWNSSRISELTGLPAREAELAQLREYSEPILWRGSSSQYARFADYLAELQLQGLEGGRFISIQGLHSKADAMYWLREQQADRDSVVTVALGDSPNDAAMLEAADIAVVIKSGKSDRITLQNPKQVIRTNRPGPAGWHDAISQVLQQLDNNTLFQTQRTA